MSNKELRDEFVSIDQLINSVGCYGISDLMWLNAIEKEIEKRGGEIETCSDVIFRDDEE